MGDEIKISWIALATTSICIFTPFWVFHKSKNSQDGTLFVKWKAISIIIVGIACLLYQSFADIESFISLEEVQLEHKAKNPILEIIGENDLCLETRKEEVKRRQEIFFIETSGEDCLTARQACSIESASRTNPDANVVVYMESNGPLPGEFYAKWKANYKEMVHDRRRCSITKTLFRRFQNIRLVKEDLLTHLVGTPLEKLLKINGVSFDESTGELRGGIRDSQFPLEHRSDLVRVAHLWRHGGIYLDLDIFVLRPLYCLRNTVGLGNWKAVGENWVENGVVTFDAGHPFLEYLMHYLVEEYRPNNYFSLGPFTFSSSLLDFCETDELPTPETGGTLSCWNETAIQFQARNVFYALDNRGRNVFYDKSTNLSDVEQLKKSFVSHAYDSKVGIADEPESLFANLAKIYCPVTYKMAMDEFGAF